MLHNLVLQLLSSILCGNDDDIISMVCVCVLSVRLVCA
jgi:hypothetical protein